MVYGAFFLPHTDSKKNFKSQFQTNNRIQIVPPFPKKRLGGTIVGKWLTFNVILPYSI